MSVKVTVPNTSSDSVVFGSANTPTAAEVVGIDSGSSNGQLAFKTTASGTSTERMRIDANGNVGIGTSTISTGYISGNGSLTLQNAKSIAINNSSNTWNTTNAGGAITYFTDNNLYIDAKDSTSNILFRVNTATERMRIDSSGNVLVGTTGTTLSGFTGVQLFGQQSGAPVMLNASRNDVASVSTTGLITAYSNYSTTQEKFIVRANGDVQNRTGSYTAYSDERLKENIVDARSYTDDLCKLRVVNYEFKADTIKTKYLGFVAQEVEKVMPGLIITSNSDGIEDCKGVKLTVMIPMLVKAIQEQQELIKQLQADVATLKGTA